MKPKWVAHAGTVHLLHSLRFGRAYTWCGAVLLAVRNRDFREAKSHETACRDCMDTKHREVTT